MKQNILKTFCLAIAILTFGLNIWSQIVIKSYDNGAAHILGNESNKNKQGKWIELSSHGDTLAIVNFKDDKLEGPFMFKEDASVLNPNEILVKNKEEYSHLFEIDYKAEGNFNNNLLQGKYAVYTVTGKIGSITIYDKGKANGLRKSFYITGDLAFEESYENDQLHGEWREYHKNGKLREERFYEKGIHMTSTNFEWSKEGNLSKKLSYIFVKNEDQRVEKINHGKWTQYYEDGSILSESHYDMGSADGTWIGYYQSGNVKYKMIYEDKVYINYEKFDDK